MEQGAKVKYIALVAVGADGVLAHAEAIGLDGAPLPYVLHEWVEKVESKALRKMGKWCIAQEVYLGCDMRNWYGRDDDIAPAGSQYGGKNIPQWFPTRRAARAALAERLAHYLVHAPEA